MGVPDERAVKPSGVEEGRDRTSLAAFSTTGASPPGLRPGARGRRGRIDAGGLKVALRPGEVEPLPPRQPARIRERVQGSMPMSAAELGDDRASMY
jgi:hypothetical protein